MPITITHDHLIGGTKHLYAGLATLEGDYPAGGVRVDVPGISRLDVLQASPGAGHAFRWDGGTQRLVVLGPGLVELEDGAWVDVVTDFLAIGA